MKKLAVTILIICLAVLVFSIAGIIATPSFAQEPPKIQLRGAPSQVVEAPPVIVEQQVVVPVKKAITPEEAENLISRWTNVIIAAIGAIATIVGIIWTKVVEAKHRAAVTELELRARMDRIDLRGQATEEKTQVHANILSAHTGVCPPHNLGSGVRPSPSSVVPPKSDLPKQ